MSQSSRTVSRHTVVIGAGPGGLAVAMLLAKSGMRVTIIEKRNDVGGRTSTIHKDGFKFDTGPTFFLYPSVLREIFQHVGYNLDREVAMTRLDPQYRLVFGSGGELLATPNVEDMKRSIAAISPEDAVRFEDFITHNRKKLKLFTPFLQQPFESWTDLLTPDVMKLLPLLAPWKSLDDDLKVHFKDERIRLGFSFQSKYLGMSPFRCPSLFSILSFLEYEHGVYHPRGGCGAVTTAMARIAREMGVTICLNESVNEILTDDGEAVGVSTTTRLIHADAVVLNADFPGAVLKLLPPKTRKRWTDRRISKAKYSCSTFMLYLGIRGTYDDVSHHTIYLAEDYKENLLDIERRHVLSKNPSFYVQNACVTDSSLAPSGFSTLYVLLPVTHETGSVDWPRCSANYRAIALRQLEKIGLIGVEDRIMTEHMLTPNDWKEQFDLYRGATFSMAHSLDQLLHLRPHNRYEDIKQMYLVGGGTHPGSGLPVIFESARITARLLLQDLNIESCWNLSDNEVLNHEMSTSRT